MTPRRDEAEIAAALAEALAEIVNEKQAEQAAAEHRIKRDAAILRANQGGAGIPEISRELEMPASTVRHSTRQAELRAARG